MGKNIVICCDGTGNEYGKNNTNVVKLFEMLTPSEGQKIFYDPGVGTFSSALLVPLQKIKQATSQALGLDLHRNVEDAYYYLMNVYQEGDRIFLFGFSRGAHTVRRLATMLEKCGLLHRGSENMIPYASRMYLDKKVPKSVSEGFLKTFSRPCPVYFIGVWDTVKAVWRFLPKPRLDGVMSKQVQYSYHAVSIDEKRLQFPPSLWKEDVQGPDQVVEQVWFAGVHSDVGGWYPQRGLSNIALKWLAKKAAQAGLEIKSGSIEKIEADPLAKQHESWTGMWWLLPYHIYLAVGIVAAFAIERFSSFSVLTEYWYAWVAVGVGLIFLNQKRRNIPLGSKVHSSVRDRYEAKQGYRPRNLVPLMESGKIVWVND